MTAARTIAQEAHEHLLARAEAEGNTVDLVRRVAEEVSRRCGVTVTADVVVWTLVEVALERHRRQTEGAEHLRDALAHLAVLAQLRAVEAAEAANTDTTGRWAGRRSS